MYSKHKDAEPLQTVKTIKEIYSTIGLTMEYTIEKHIDGVYSAYLYDSDGKWNVAGKGTTLEYCLASAYGESIEHLCNHFAFDISKVSGYAKEYEGFYRYYDEIIQPIEQIKEVSPAVFNDMKLCCGNSEELKESDIFEVWKKVLMNEETPFVPYFNVTSLKTELLPDAVLSKMCGSNGGGSGNSQEEALGHALDEAIERYVKYQIVFNKLTPPDVPQEYIKERCPELFDLIRKIEVQGQFRLIVKDASLGKGFSVVCIMVIDTYAQRYLTNFGAHPCFEIALERCLTELFQDHECVKNLIDRADMTSWNSCQGDCSADLSNWISLLRDDIGQVPNSMFLKRESWRFVPWKVFDEYNNSIGVRYQLNILKENNFDVYIRDNSFLGFPVYKVYIPIVSMSHIIFDQRLIEETNIASNIYFYLINGMPLGIKRDFCKYAFCKDSFLVKMRLRNWDADCFSFLFATLLFDTGQLEEALSVIKTSNIKSANFLRCYIELIISGEESNNRTHLLQTFFGDEASSWLKFVSDGNAFSLLQEHCHKSGLIQNNHTDYLSEKDFRDKLYMKIKEASKKADINQVRILDLLSSLGCV